MEGMLIFAGLFSAVLTAFLIESYKTLNPDPEDLTVRLLTRISEQIVASANGNASNIPQPLELNDSGPTRLALACNALWFLSLGLSLSCALIATLLEQWAREFLHRTDIHSAPVIRARIFSFLYYGLRRFNMHAIVDIMPLLLHLSLLLFYAGLIAFLVPVNTGVAIIATAMLFVVATTYSVLTFFPLRYLDSPYRTPLTGLFWNLFQYLKILRNRHPSPSRPADPAAHSETASATIVAVHSETAHETMVATISRVAAEPSKQRKSRDLKALVWTMKSLADDTEFEPFVDAISGILWDPDGWRTENYAVLHTLVNDPQTLLYERIMALFHSCNAAILTPADLKRRKIICSKALWTTIPLLCAEDATLRKQLFALRISAQYFEERDPEILHYACSVEAMARWREFEGVKIVLNNYLLRLQATSGGVGADEVSHIQDYMYQLALLWFYHFLYGQLRRLKAARGTSLDHQISTLVGTIQHALTATPHLIHLHYLQSASMLVAPPYCFSWTVSFLRPLHNTPRPLHNTPPTVRNDLDATFDKVVPRLLKDFNCAEPGWMDSVMTELIRSWKWQGNFFNELTLHPELVRYLNHRRANQAVTNAVGSSFMLFWHALANTLESTTATRTRLRDSLTAACRVISLDELHVGSLVGSLSDESLILRLLDDCMRLDIPSVTPSLIAALKIAALKSSLTMFGVLRATNPDNAMHRCSTVVCEFSTNQPLIVGDGDASVVLFAEYLEICAKSTADLEFPHEAMSTLRLMDKSWFRTPQIHATHQIRFAHALRDFFESPACERLRFTIIAETWLFKRYLDPGQRSIPRWLDNSTARDLVMATLTQFVEKLECSAEADTGEIVHQTRTVLAALRSSSENEATQQVLILSLQCYPGPF
ncbi:hypothetical protein R3P38DRAFT_2536711 [Favolaschia claudopus]|uniref:DUF6535 domain-containing protein n=1 Tax=Favolaschia claudopus TaxID=2862362 RepID=A0AAW0B2G2_9AGAR